MTSEELELYHSSCVDHFYDTFKLHPSEQELCLIQLHFILRCPCYTFKYWVILINYMYLSYG